MDIFEQVAAKQNNNPSGGIFEQVAAERNYKPVKGIFEQVAAEQPDSWGNDLLNMGKAAVSLSTPVITFPTAIASGLFNTAGQKTAEIFDKNLKKETAADIFRKERKISEEKSAEMLKMYEPEAGSAGAKIVEKAGKVFGSLTEIGREVLDTTAEMMGLSRESFLRELMRTGGELAAFEVAGKAVRAGKTTTKAAAQKIIAGMGEERLKGNLEYTPSVESPSASVRPTPKEEITRLQEKPKDIFESVLEEQQVGEAAPDIFESVANEIKATKALEGEAGKLAESVADTGTANILPETTPKVVGERASESIHPLAEGESAVTTGSKNRIVDAERLSVSPQEESVTGIKKRIVDAEQEARGFPEVEREIIRIIPTYEEGRNLIASGKINPRALAADLVDNHRMLTPTEAGVLIADRVSLKNQERSLMIEIREAMQNGDKALESAKRAEFNFVERDLGISAQAAQVNRETWSALGKMMQLEAKQDFTLENLVRKAEVSTGKEVTPEHRAILEKHANEIKRLQEEIAIRDEKISQREYVREVEKLKNIVAKEQRDVKRTIKKEVLDAKLNNLYAELNSVLGGQLNVGIDPTAIPIFAKLAKTYVERGIITAEGIVDAIYTQAKNMGLDLSKRDIRDAISGYGTTKTMNQEAIVAQLRELKRQMALISGLEDATKGVPPVKRFQADVETPRVRELKKQIKQAMKDSGIDLSKIPTTEQQWKTSLEATKTRLKNQINDLTKEILTREKIAKKQGVSATDEETRILETYRDGLKNINDVIFEDPSLEAAKKAKLLQSAINRELIRLDKQIQDYVKRTSEKDITSRKREVSPPKTEDIKLMRDVRDIAKKSFEDMKRELTPKKSPEEIALQAYKTRTANKISELESKRISGDFSKKEKKAIKLDEPGQNLKFRLSQEYKAYYESAAKYQRENRTRGEKIWDSIKEAGNITRAIKTSMDLSAVLRQGGFIAFGHPVRALKAMPDMFKALRSEEGRFTIDQEILNRPNYHLYEQSKLYLAEHGQVLSKMEEAYMSHLVDSLAKGSPFNPVALVFKGVKASERAYSTFLNRLRADSFDIMYKNLAKDGSAAEINAISNYINIATGRGSVGKNRVGVVNQLATMNSLFFAPRYVLSRFQLLAGEPLYRGTARTRAMIVKEYARFFTGLSVVYALGLAAGGKLESDPRSSDFGKIRFGKTRLDPLAGLSQTAVVTARLGAGTINAIMPKTFRGNVKIDKRKIVEKDVLSVAGRFGRSKLNPIAGIVVDLGMGKGYIGQEINLMYAGGQFVPLALSDIHKAMLEQGVPAGTALSMLAIFGMGLQTYDNKRGR